MLNGLQSPSNATYWFIQGRDLFLLIHVLGTLSFAYIVARRLQPLFRGERDFRLDRPVRRIGNVVQYWLGQWRHPRYRFAGIVHILIFAGFILLATRAFALILGIADDSAAPTAVGEVYSLVRQYATTIVFLCMVVAAVRRLLFRPARYAVPPQFGRVAASLGSGDR